MFQVKIEIVASVEEDQLPSFLAGLQSLLRPEKKRATVPRERETIVESLFPDFPHAVDDRIAWFKKHVFGTKPHSAGWMVAKTGYTPVDLLIMSKKQFLAIKRCGPVSWGRVLQFREENKDKLSMLEGMGLMPE